MFPPFIILNFDSLETEAYFKMTIYLFKILKSKYKY